MKNKTPAIFACLICAAGLWAQAHYTSDNKMQKPENYREWIFLSAGVGMAYTPAAEGAKENPDPAFDNVFVNPEAWKAFRQTGKWPDKTVMVLEVRQSSQKGSITQRGRFQKAPIGVEVHVKDEKRFAATRGWAFFEFHGAATEVAMTPAEKECYSCHQDHGTLDTTFAQFYPTVHEIAEKKGTLTAEK
jgi:hypothetical protein